MNLVKTKERQTNKQKKSSKQPKHVDYYNIIVIEKGYSFEQLKEDYILNIIFYRKHNIFVVDIYNKMGHFGQGPCLSWGFYCYEETT